MTKVSQVKIFNSGNDDQLVVAASIQRGEHSRVYCISKDSAWRMTRIVWRLMQNGGVTVRPFLGDIGFVADIAREKES